jgi:malate synthase
MADFEDSLSPTWSNVVEGQINLRDAVAGSIAYSDPESGKDYRVGERRGSGPTSSPPPRSISDCRAERCG